jgi:putative transposase
MNIRNTTPSSYISYGLNLYFSGLSLRRVSERLSCFVKRNHVSVWNWIQKYRPQKTSSRRKKTCEFIVDETLIKAGSEYTWLWAAIEPKKSKFSHCPHPKRETCLLLRGLSQDWLTHGKHPVSTDGGTWYPQACRFLKLDHHIHSSFEKSPMERTMQWIKDRTECFDDYFPCKKKKCKLKHVINWLNLFADFHNRGLKP